MRSTVRLGITHFQRNLGALVENKAITLTIPVNECNGDVSPTA